jgi:hypothetical protein
MSDLKPSMGRRENSFVSQLERLTWDNRGPAPYESAANVFMKLMLLNSATHRELAETIQRRSLTNASSSIEFINGEWLDFNVFSSLLRVDQARLKQGFLDWLGFNGPLENISGIRRCPECTRLRYHCSLFNLRIIDCCPWHGCRIQEPCKECLHQIWALGGPRYRWSNYRRCDCGNDISPLFEGSGVNAVPAELAAQIDVYCRRFVGWWATVKHNQTGAAELLSTVVSVGSFARNYHFQTAMAVGWALKLAPFPTGWEHIIEPVASRAIELAPGRRQTGSSLRAGLDATREFACVRRYIFRRFVRRHKKCLNAILRMTDVERHCLDSRAFCSVCVAYLTWIGRHSLTHGRVIRDRYYAAVDSYWTAPIEIEKSPDWGSFAEQVLLRFTNNWAEIEHKVEHSNLQVHSSTRTKRDVKIPSAIIEKAEIDTDFRHALILIPDEAALEQRAASRCKAREAQGISMIDDKGYARQVDFSWGNSQDYDSFDGYTSIFKIKDYSEIQLTKSNSYTAIYP